MNVNESPVGVVRYHLGWVGHYRLDWRTEWFEVRNGHGDPIVRTTRAEAERDAWAEKYRREHPVIYGDNMFQRTARSAAEALFKGAI